MSLFRGFGHDTRPQVYMEWHERKKFTFPKIRFEGVQRSKENPLVKVFVQSPNPQRVGWICPFLWADSHTKFNQDNQVPHLIWMKRRLATNRSCEDRTRRPWTNPFLCVTQNWECFAPTTHVSCTCMSFASKVHECVFNFCHLEHDVQCSMII